MTDDQPLWGELHLRCGKCETRWMDWQPSNCRIEVWVAVVNALTCPKCSAGADKLFLVPLDTPDSDP